MLGLPVWPVESPGAALRAVAMELADDPIDENDSQDLCPGAPQQQQGEDIDNSDDEAPAGACKCATSSAAAAATCTARAAAGPATGATASAAAATEEGAAFVVGLHV